MIAPPQAPQGWGKDSNKFFRDSQGETLFSPCSWPMPESPAGRSWDGSQVKGLHKMLTAMGCTSKKKIQGTRLKIRAGFDPQAHCHVGARSLIHVQVLVQSVPCPVPQMKTCVCPTDEELFSGDSGVDLLIEDQLLRQEDLLMSATRRPATTRHAAAVSTDASVQATAISSEPAQASASAPSLVDPASQAPDRQLLASPQTTTVSPETMGVMPSTQVSPTTVAHTAIQPPPAMIPGDIFVEALHLVPMSPDTVGTDMAEEEGTARQEATSASPILSPEEEDDIRNVIGKSFFPRLVLL